MESRIKELRQALGLTQTKFGELVSLKQNSLSLIESGKFTPGDRTLLLIAEKTKCSYEWLKDGTGEMFPPRAPAEEIADLMTGALTDLPDGFRGRLIKALAKLTPDQWDLLETIVDEIADTKKER